MNIFDSYKILGAHPGMSQQELKSQHRTLSQTYHPDRADGGDSTRFVEIQQAWSLIKTPEARSTLSVRMMGLGTLCPFCSGKGYIRKQGKGFSVSTLSACGNCRSTGFVER